MSNIKFQQALGNTAEFIKDNKKPILIIGGAVAVVIIGIVAVKGASGSIDKFFSGDYKGSTGFIKQPVDSSKATISEDTAKTYANQLYNAMAKAGTDESVIKAIMNKINGDDFKMIYNAFGIRSYYNFGAPTISAYLFGYADLDMNEWFKREVNSLTDFLTYNLIKKRSNEAGLAF